MIGRLGTRLRGWANDFNLGTVSRAYHAVNYHETSRLNRWLCWKQKVLGPGYSRYADRYLYRKLGLDRIQRPRRSFLTANV
jgi:RNA-directed DNA polymerase